MRGCLLCYSSKRESIPSFPFVFLFNTHPFLRSPTWNTQWMYFWYKLRNDTKCTHASSGFTGRRYICFHVIIFCYTTQTAGTFRQDFDSSMIFVKFLELHKEIILLYKPNSSQEYLLITHENNLWSIRIVTPPKGSTREFLCDLLPWKYIVNEVTTCAWIHILNTEKFLEITPP